jgi:hypothetical protein
MSGRSFQLSDKNPRAGESSKTEGGAKRTWIKAPAFLGRSKAPLKTCQAPVEKKSSNPHIPKRKYFNRLGILLCPELLK